MTLVVEGDYESESSRAEGSRVAQLGCLFVPLAWLLLAVGAFYAVGSPPPGPERGAALETKHATAQAIIGGAAFTSMLAAAFGLLGWSGAPRRSLAIVALAIVSFLLAVSVLH